MTLVSFYALSKLYSATKSIKGEHHGVEGGEGSKVLFPTPKRNFQAEKEEFVASYIKMQEQRHK